MKLFLILVWSVIYCSIGITLQHFKIINHPAYWSLYGSLMGSILTTIILSFK